MVKRGVEATEFPSMVDERLRLLGVLPNQKVLVGFSGGQDSTALLLALADGGYFPGEVVAAHLDHGVREGSDREAGEVEGFCRSLGVLLLKGRLDSGEVRCLARKKGSLEASLRELRYQFLLSCAASCGARWVLTGHTRDDQVETVLFRVLRGMNPLSFSGIPEKRAPFLRPLLGVARSRTLSFCLEKGVEPLADPSNLDRRFARNRIRGGTIPFLKNAFHEELEDLLLRLGSAAGRMGAIMERILEERFPGVGDPREGDLSMTEFQTLPPAFKEGMLAYFLWARAGRRPSKALLTEIFRRIGNDRQGGPVSLSGDRVLVIREGRISVRDRDLEADNDIPLDPVFLPVPGKLRFASAGITLSAGRTVLGRDFTFPAGDTVLLRKNGLQSPLWVRRRHSGDRFAPLGAVQSKKLKDFFIDRKVPRSDRDRIPLVLDDTGEIVWVAGVEISGKAALTGNEGEEGIWIRIARENRPGSE